jgi:hypothetical protein
VPERVQYLARGHHGVGVQHEVAEDRPLPDAAQLDLRTAGHDLDRPEHGELHGFTPNVESARQWSHLDA